MIGSIQQINSQSLNAKLVRLRASEREIVSEIIACLSEVDSGRVYRDWGYPSLFEYCTRGLGYSESAAFRRIAVARSVQQFPQVLEQLKSGKINLTTASLVAPHLTRECAEKLLEDVSGKTQNQVKEIVALRAVESKPDAEVRVDSSSGLFSALPSPVLPSSVLSSPVLPSSVLRLEAKRNEKIKLVVAKTEEDSRYFRKQATSFDEKLRYELKFSVSRECQRKLDRARVVMSSKFPRGASLEEALEELLDGYLERKERLTRVTSRKEPSQVFEPGNEPSSRHIPAAVRRQVVERDRGKCAYVSPEGVRCGCEWDVEVDHVLPFSLGGTHELENLRLLCRAHNILMAEQVFGESGMRRARAHPNHPLPPKPCDSPPRKSGDSAASVMTCVV